MGSHGAFVYDVEKYLGLVVENFYEVHNYELLAED
jgi:hypothetical protein